MIDSNKTTTKYGIDFTKVLKKQFKKIIKQGKDINKFLYVVEKLANKEILESKYKNHSLNNCKDYYNCEECHIEPDWLLIYRYQNDELILLLVATGSHSELFQR